MSELKFKTTINCNNCVRSVSGFLNEDKNIQHWEVDINNPDKILTVKGEHITAKEVVDLVEEAGFDITPVQ